MSEQTELLEAIAKGRASGAVLEGLKEYFIRRKEVIFRKLCNAKPDLAELLDIKASARELSLMEQEFLIQKLDGEKAQEELNNL